MKKTICLLFLLVLVGCTNKNSGDAITPTSEETTQTSTTSESTTTEESQYDQLLDNEKKFISSLVSSAKNEDDINNANIVLYGEYHNNNSKWAYVKLSNGKYYQFMDVNGISAWQEASKSDYEASQDSSYSEQYIEKMNLAFHDKLESESINISKQETIENNSNDISISNAQMNRNGDSYVISGSITNNLNHPVYFVKLKISLKDFDGNCIDTQSTYACGDEGLNSDESTKFECYIDYDSNAKNYSIEVYDYQQ